MKEVHESEVFMLLDKKSNIREKCISNISKTGIDLGVILEDQLKTVARIFKDPLIIKAIDAVHNKTLMLYYTPQLDRLPVYYPFVKFKKGGVPMMGVDLTNHASVTKDKVTGELSVKIDNKKLYCLMVSGYLYLTVFNEKTVTLPPMLAKTISNMWARLFCKILIAKVGLGTNKDRLDAFMYFAQKFFLLNICECNPNIAEDIAVMQFRTKDVNPTAKTIAEACQARSIDMYQSLTVFCETLFNADITGLNSMRLAGSNDGITFDYFVRQYIQTYYAASGLALASLPHFVWMLISACSFSYIFNDAMIEKECTTDYPKMMSEIYRMI